MKVCPRSVTHVDPCVDARQNVVVPPAWKRSSDGLRAPAAPAGGRVQTTVPRANLPQVPLL
jgi:hypothetical protein